MTLFPFRDHIIPVCEGIASLIQFIEDYPAFSFCFYVADKDSEGWAISTSRRYMNQVLPGFLYIPVNVHAGDLVGLRDLIAVANADSRVAAVNITQPHKSSPVLRRMFLGDAEATGNIDTLIKGDSLALEPYDLNAGAFVGWFLDAVGSFADVNVVVVGVGGTGEPIAKLIASQHPSELFLVDPADRSGLSSRLNAIAPTVYVHSLRSLPVDRLFARQVIVVNASGKDAHSDDSSIQALLATKTGSANVFVDIRPHLTLEIVKQATALGWQAFSGYGMNARNDYILLEGIARYLGLEPLPFGEFAQRVARSS